MPQEYESKPDRVEAELLTVTNGPELAKWCGGFYNQDDESVLYPTVRGNAECELNWYLIRDSRTGWFSCMYKDEFEKRYFKKEARVSSTATYVSEEQVADTPNFDIDWSAEAQKAIKSDNATTFDPPLLFGKPPMPGTIQNNQGEN